MYESGSYDGVVDKLSEKAMKANLDSEQIEILANSYHRANEADYKRIIELKKSGQADIWLEIYYKTLSIDSRQNKIDKLSDELKAKISYQSLNLAAEIKTSKEKAEAYLFAKANYLLRTPSEENVAEAQNVVNQLYKLNPKNANLDELRVNLVVRPSKRVLLRVATPVDLHLPDDFAQLVLNFDDDNILGVPFDVVADESKDYDLMIRIMIEKKIISPSLINSVQFEEEKDGKYADVTDKTMTKSASIVGQIEFVDVKKGDILLHTPFDIASTFVYKYAEVDGELSACSEQTLEYLRNKPIDFPSDSSMLRDIARKLNSIIRERYQKKIKKI